MITFPNAKINLGLNIVERRPDGYHNLETVFYPIGLADALEVVPHDGEVEGCTLHMGGTPVGGNAADNLVAQAYRLLQTRHRLPPVDAYLHKQIPSGAGLGGGSADAAFMLKMLNELGGLHLSDAELEAHAASLGADCAFFVRNRPVFATRIGDRFESVPLTLKGWHLVMVKPDIFVSTRNAFALVRPQRPALSVREIVGRPVEAWRDHLKNDFEDSVFPLHPAIGAIKQSLYAHGATYASMSGSGSSVFGLFADRPEQASAWFPDCFVWTGECAV